MSYRGRHPDVDILGLAARAVRQRSPHRLNPCGQHVGVSHERAHRLPRRRHRRAAHVGFHGEKRPDCCQVAGQRPAQRQTRLRHDLGQGGRLVHWRCRCGLAAAGDQTLDQRTEDQRDRGNSHRNSWRLTAQTNAQPQTVGPEFMQIAGAQLPTYLTKATTARYASPHSP